MMIRAEGVHTYYGPSHILHGIDFTIDRAEAVSLIGRNGAGKTTLMRSLMQLTAPKSGSIKNWDGVELTRIKPHDVYRMGIKLVPQGRRVFPKLTVEENLKLAMIGQKLKDPKTELEKTYERFQILGERRKQIVRGLSGGQRQILAIGRALLGDTKVLLMDEPTEGLAPLMVKLLHDLILEIKKTGITILLAEQNVKMALSVCDRHYILEKGEIRFSGSTDDLTCDPDILMQTLGVSTSTYECANEIIEN